LMMFGSDGTGALTSPSNQLVSMRLNEANSSMANWRAKAR